MSNTFSVEKEFQCPQCGYLISLYFKHVKLIQCESCHSNIFLEDDAVRLSGDSSVLTSQVSLLNINQPFFYAQKSYLPLGKIRYSYGRGFWEEWWVKDHQDKQYWLSIDEGDLVLQKSIKTHYDKTFFDTLHIGMKLPDGWVVTELAEATCEGFEGSLPKEVLVGSTYAYAHLSGKDAQLQTLECIDDKVQTYSGKWISPFDIGKIH